MTDPKPITLQTGTKFDTGKLRYDLVNADAHRRMVEILTFGAQKYDDRNWEKGMPWSRLIASLKRHLAAIESGEDYDPESGKLHVDHVACNAHFLSAYYKIHPQGDNRPHKMPNNLKVGLDIDGVLADFVGHLMKVSGNEGHQPIHWNDPIVRREFDKVKNDPAFWAGIPPLLTREDIPFEPHAYITARSVDTSVTQEWLNKHLFPLAPLYCVGVGESKVEVARKAGIDVMVDDSITNYAELNSNGVFCYLYDAYYNQKYNVGYKRIKSLKELV